MVLHDPLTQIERHVQKKIFNMEVLPAELHPHVDAIDIEEGFYSMLSLALYSPNSAVVLRLIRFFLLQTAH